METYQIEVDFEDDLEVSVFKDPNGAGDEYWIDAQDSASGQFVETRITDKGRRQIMEALK